MRMKLNSSTPPAFRCRRRLSARGNVPSHFRLERLESYELFSATPLLNPALDPAASGSNQILVGGGTPPATPDGIHASAISSSSIQITWNDNASDETGYEIQAAGLYWGSWVTVGTTGANATSFSETGMSSGASFQYRVRALGTSADSNWTADGSTFATTVTSHDASTSYHISTYQDANGGFSDFQDGLAEQDLREGLAERPPAQFHIPRPHSRKATAVDGR